MPRVDEPKVDLQKLRLALGLTTQEAARRIGVTDSILVHYESKGWGYDRQHDADALDAYLTYAVAAYGSDDLYHRVFTTERTSAPAATEALTVTSKGNPS